MNGSAPNASLTGSQSCPMTKAKPNRRIAGADSTTRAPTMPTMTRTNSPTAPYTTPRKTRSPHTLLRRAKKEARGTGTPSVTPVRAAVPSTISARGEKGLAVEVDLFDLRLDLLDHRRRQRRIQQV